MLKPGVTAVAIVKNEQAILHRMLRSIVGWVDHIIICDTGSTDDTIAIAEKYGAQVIHYEWNNHFSDARNYAMSHVKTYWTLTLDADDIVINPEVIRSTIEAYRQKHDGFWATYNQDEFSSHNRLSLVRTDKFYWKGAVHESLQPKDERTNRRQAFSSLYIMHLKPPDRNKDAALQYLNIIQTQDPDNHFGIAESHRMLENTEQAIEAYLRHYNWPKANHSSKYTSIQWATYLSLEKAIKEKSAPWLDKAQEYAVMGIQLDPERAECLTFLGEVLTVKGNKESAKQCFNKAIQTTPPKFGYYLSEFYHARPLARLEALSL